MVTLSIDGREVTAPENSMLVDGAKYGDVEIPVFCYEPKLGQPVGACRMCLVEIEGIPKLQTACSTPVKDGMVVHTQTDRVHTAQRGVVEFLLINHPLDCPVCDKGGECPLQDITYGWGPGSSRFIEPKRHFVKPLELSPLIAIDRERCILCYRCVRFSQEVAQDDQLVLLERGAHSYVGTFDGHPYVGPFSGNIIELCPVGALTSRAYRFRARPWEIEGAGSVCTLCPAQCNIEFTVRDDRVLRVLARDNDGVDDGWLCDKGRFAYQSVHSDERITQPLVRDGDELRPASWEHALDVAAAALAKAGGGRAAALAGGETTNEEAFLLRRLLAGGLGSDELASRPGGGPGAELARALADPGLQATVPDLEFADAVLVLDCDPIDDAPILDLRIRKGVRRRGVRLAVASSRPGALDRNAAAVLRYGPGAGAGALAALDAALAGEPAPGDDSDRGLAGEQAVALAGLLRAGGGDVVVLYGERLTSGPGGARAARALLNVAARLGLHGRAGAGLLEIPSSANGRGLRELGLDADTDAVAQGLLDGRLSTLALMHCDPLRSHPDRARWSAALAKAQAVIAHDTVLTEGLREHATVIFPAEAYAEKEGTVTHPDGRLQRLRVAIGRPPEVRAGWQALSELARRAGHDLEILTGAMASRQMFDSVPAYAGLTLEEIGGHGVRWPEREAASALGGPAPEVGRLDPGPPAASPNGALRLGTFRSLWSSKEVALSPALQFLAPAQTAELSPVDAERLGIAHGDRVRVGSDGQLVTASVALRAAVPTGSVFLAEGTGDGDSANALTGALVEVRLA